jgi:hypothetical protein
MAGARILLFEQVRDGCWCWCWYGMIARGSQNGGDAGWHDHQIYLASAIFAHPVLEWARFQDCRGGPVRVPKLSRTAAGFSWHLTCRFPYAKAAAAQWEASGTHDCPVVVPVIAGSVNRATAIRRLYGRK